jgi:hypothetical protein
MPSVSIVIPVYNEEGILREAVDGLTAELRATGWDWEIILAENGSRDQTLPLGEHLAAENRRVSIFHCEEPNYGAALSAGILRARGEFVICEEIDLCDADFHRRAIELLVHDDADMVVGSKVMKGSHDARPLFRRTATRVINGMLRVAVGFKGTDTHGLKAFKTELLVPIVHQCVVGKDLFASEFVIRAGREGLRVVEIPVRIAEKRPPAINLTKRVPRVLSDLARLTWQIRVKDKDRQ